MEKNLSRRKFIKTGLALPAAGPAASAGLKNVFAEEPHRVVYRTLGKTGLKVSGVGYGIGFVPIPEVVSRALDMARVYCDSEKIFSGVIKGRDRSKIVVATKSSSHKKAYVLNDIDTSLKALGTDYVDIWHLHGRDTPDTIPDEVLTAMQEIKKSGKARFLGVSCHNPNSIVDFLIETKTFDVMQTTYSFPIGGYFRDRAIK